MGRGERNVELVRRVFDARRAGRVQELLDLLSDDALVIAKADGRRLFGREQIRAYLDRDGDPRRVEVSATRLEACEEDRVTVHGRLRIFTGRGMSDSPATWTVTVREGRVRAIA